MKYSGFKPSEYRPEGWLRRQLEIQADGLSGNLDKIWPDVRDSAWIGGTQDSWERVPYWLDGFIPLAWLLDDEDKKARAKHYVDAIVAQQQSDGWIAPCPPEKRATYDVWAIYLIGKVLALYCEFTGDRRVERALYKAYKNFYELLKEGKVKVFAWAKSRWFEAFIPIKFLYDKKKEEWLKDLAKMLRAAGTDYEALTDRWVRPLNKWTQETHIVNIAMMFKYEALVSDLLGEPYENKAEKLWRHLYKYNGTAVGTLNGDECLAGTANNRGFELCSVVELMYSFECLYRITGEPVWADRLERVAFNALPATVSDDMWTHQYDQQVNQIACVKFTSTPFFGTNFGDAHLFGLEPNFGCCTANFNQGWPKLTMNVFHKCRGGIEVASMLPATLKTRIKGCAVTVKTDSEYPFKNKASFTVCTDSDVSFTLKIRIPSFAEGVIVNGKEIAKSRYVIINKVWSGCESICVELICKPRLCRRDNGLYFAQYGALLYSLPIKAEYKTYEYEKNGVPRKFPYCDYELYPRSDWNYGFVSDDFKVVESNGSDVPFSADAPRTALAAKMRKVAWEYAPFYDTVANEKPVSCAPISEEAELLLVPYGAAKLRMTEMPIVKIKK